MKLPVKVLFIILFGFSLLPGFSQSRGIIAGEYFWDTDPGQGHGNPMIAANGSFGPVFQEILQNPLSLPAIGTHTLNVRAEDSLGNWGAVFTTVVQVDSASTSLRADNIVTAEYFWDTDPGQGSGNPMVAFDGSFNQAFEAISQNPALLPAIGTHTLNVRAKDITGKWGVVFTTVVQVDSASTSIRADNIIAAEYYWDTDPGQGSANPMVAFDGSFNQAFEAISKNPAVLPAIGTHTLNVRAKDVTGKWGVVFTTVVQVDSASTSIRADNIIAAEYYWDTDPGQGSANPMVAFDGSFNQAFEAISQNPALLPAIGTHTLNVRAKDVTGKWGVVFTTVVQVDSASTSIRADNIIAAEYYWDTDPGQGSANPMVAFDGSFNQAFEAISKNPAVLPAIGTHTLNVRAKDVTGKWGVVFTTVVQVDSASTSIRADNIIAAEYYWDTDPGQGSANPMVAFDGSFNQAFEAISQNPAVLPAIGTHTLNVRAKDVTGKWGSVFTVVVIVGPSSTSIRSDAVVAAEYFFDTDPGQGNGTPMLAQGGSFGSAFQDLLGGSIPSPVTAGVHLLSMRSKDINGNWGQVFSVVVNIDTTIGAPNVQITGPTVLCANNLAGAVYSTPSDTGNTYTWSITGGTITSGAGTNSVIVTWNSTGPYKLKVTECAGTDCGSDSVVLTVNPVAATTINHTMCQGLVFDGYSTGGTYVDTFTATNGCDSIRTLNLTVLPVPRTTVNQTICQGQSYLGFTQTGTYIDTFTAANSCDSIRTLNLTVLSNATTTVTTSICQGQNYDGHITTGTFIDTFQAQNGCDSIRTLNLTVNPVVHTTITTSICQGQNYDGHSTTGTFVDTLTGSNSCDSIRTLNLTILPVSQSTTNKSICAGASYQGHTQSGTYVDTLTGTNGCDSISTLVLTVLNPVRDTVNQSICLGQSYGGHTATGTYIDTFTAANSCDSIRTLNLTVTNGIHTAINQSICPGHSFDGYSQTGTYVDTFTAVGGCDSIRTLNLTVLSNVTTNISQSICAGLTYDGHSTNGTFVDTFPSANGCDSIRTLLLTILPVENTTVNTQICHGQSYAGHSTTGTFVDTLQGVNGCDSIRTLNLIVLPLVTTTIDQNICQGQSYDGHTATGTYVDTFTSTNGCDSIRTLNLVVSNSITTTVNKNICQGLSYDGHDTTGTYIDSFIATGGCDSVRTLHLTVNSNLTTTVNQNICQGTAYDGHSATGTYVDSFTSVGGCDSIRTLNLVVLPILNTTDAETICQGQAYDGHTATGTYVDTLMSTYGCDSIRTLHLTVNPVTNDTMVQSICQGDTFNGHSTTGFYVDSMTSVTGCDSIVSLHLTVNPVPAIPTITQHGDTLVSSAATSYQWYRDSVLLTGDTAQTIVLVHNGNYTVVTGDTGGCTSTSAVLRVTNTAVTDVSGLADFQIFPNPASNLLTIQCSGLTGAGSLGVKLTDAIGQILIEKTFINPATNFTTQLNVQDLAAGVYMLQLQYNKQVITRTVVIEK